MINLKNLLFNNYQIYIFCKMTTRTTRSNVCTYIYSSEVYLMMSPEEGDEEQTIEDIEKGQFAFGWIANPMWKHWFGEQFEEIRKQFCKKLGTRLNKLVETAGAGVYTLEQYKMNLRTNQMILYLKTAHRPTKTEQSNFETLFDADFYTDLYESQSQLASQYEAREQKYFISFYFDRVLPVTMSCEKS